MCIQTPGSFVFAASLATRLGTEGWSTWGVYVVTGILQGGLLVMATIFELRDRRAKRNEEEDEEGVDEREQEANERTALLANERATVN